jgi:hypothetical protein
MPKWADMDGNSILRFSPESLEGYLRGTNGLRSHQSLRDLQGDHFYGKLSGEPQVTLVQP